MSEFRNQAILDVADVLEIDLIDYARIQRERVLEIEQALRDCRLTFEGIFVAKWREWDDDLNIPEEFIAWAKNRAFGELGKIDAILAREEKECE